MKTTAQNFWLDVSIFVMFITTLFSGFMLWLVLPKQSTAFFLGLDHQLWLTVHFYTSLASITGALIHVAWHKSWLKALRFRPTSSLPRKIAANRIVNRLIWILLLAATGFGILGWFLQQNPFQVNFFTRFHVVLAVCWVLGIIVHLVFHRKWISSSIMRIFFNMTGNVQKIHTGLVKE